MALEYSQGHRAAFARQHHHQRSAAQNLTATPQKTIETTNEQPRKKHNDDRQKEAKLTNRVHQLLSNHPPVQAGIRKPHSTPLKFVFNMPQGATLQSMEHLKKEIANNPTNMRREERQKAIWNVWSQFCDATGRSADVLYSNNSHFSHAEDLETERHIFRDFATWLVLYRQSCCRTSGAQAKRTVSTLCTIISGRLGRRPGDTVGNESIQDFQIFLRHLEMAKPVQRRLTRPVTAVDLLAIKAIMHLKSNAVHRLLWAVYATMFLGMCRTSDLLGPRRLASSYDAKVHLTRASITPESTTYSDGTNGPPKLILNLRPVPASASHERPT